jgi:NTE family protein
LQQIRQGDRRVAVVIGSGSVKCAASLGLFRALKRHGIGVSMLVGCSAGCLYASMLALGKDTAEAAEATARLWTRDVAGHRNRMALLKLLMPRTFGFDGEFGLRSDKVIMERLRTAFGDARIENAQIPLYLAATDFLTGQQKIFSRGSIVDAIRASIAVPFLFSPWRIDDRLYVDGYVSDPLPVGVAIKEGARVIVAMGFESPTQERITSGARFAFQLSSILSNNLLKSQFAFHGLAHYAEILPIIPEFTERVHLFDTGKIPYLIEEGERAAEAQMPYLTRLLDADASEAQSRAAN